MLEAAAGRFGDASRQLGLSSPPSPGGQNGSATIKEGGRVQTGGRGRHNRRNPFVSGARTTPHDWRFASVWPEVLFVHILPPLGGLQLPSTPLVHAAFHPAAGVPALARLQVAGARASVGVLVSSAPPPPGGHRVSPGVTHYQVLDGLKQQKLTILSQFCGKKFKLGVWAGPLFPWGSRKNPFSCLPWLPVALGGPRLVSVSLQSVSPSSHHLLCVCMSLLECLS